QPHEIAAYALGMRIRQAQIVCDPNENSAIALTERVITRITPAWQEFEGDYSVPDPTVKDVLRLHRQISNVLAGPRIGEDRLSADDSDSISGLLGSVHEIVEGFLSPMAPTNPGHRWYRLGREILEIRSSINPDQNDPRSWIAMSSEL